MFKMSGFFLVQFRYLKHSWQKCQFIVEGGLNSQVHRGTKLTFLVNCATGKKLERRRLNKAI